MWAHCALLYNVHILKGVKFKLDPPSTDHPPIMELAIKDGLKVPKHEQDPVAR